MSYLENELQSHIDYLNNEISAVNEIFNHKFNELGSNNHESESLKKEKYKILSQHIPKRKIK
jgi:hypothetical protein